MSTLDHRVQIKTSAEHPHGRATHVLVDGAEFICDAVDIAFRGNNLNTVTLTFPAHVTVEEGE